MFNEPDLLEKLYFHELDRKEQLEKGSTLPAGVIVASFGVIGFFFTHFKFGGSVYRLSIVDEYLFAVSLAVSVAMLCVATYWCFRAVTGSTYE